MKISQLKQNEYLEISIMFSIIQTYVDCKLKTGINSRTCKRS